MIYFKRHNIIGYRYSLINEYCRYINFTYIHYQCYFQMTAFNIFSCKGIDMLLSNIPSNSNVFFKLRFKLLVILPLFSQKLLKSEVKMFLPKKII